MKSALLVDDVPAYDGILHAALHLPAGKGGVPGLGGELLRVDGPLLLRVEDGDVRVAAQAQPPLGGQAEDGGGVVGHPPDQVGQLHPPGVVQLGEGNGQGGLQADHAAGGLGQGALLLLRGVGGVVGGDGVDGAVLQPGDDALDVLGGAQRRVHPGHGALGEHLVLGEGEVLGAGLTGEGDPPLLHPAHDIHRLGGGYVTDVHMGPGLLGQHGVPHAPHQHI